MSRPCRCPKQETGHVPYLDTLAVLKQLGLGGFVAIAEQLDVLDTCQIRTCVAELENGALCNLRLLHLIGVNHPASRNQR